MVKGALLQSTSQPSKSASSSLNLQLILNSTGLAMFSRQNAIHLRKLKKQSGAWGEGIVLNGFHFKSLKRLLRTNGIEEITISNQHFLQGKSDIIDITKMVIFTWLNRKISSPLASFLLTSKPLIRYNRLHKPPIRSIEHIGRRVAADMMLKHAGEIGFIKSRLGDLVLNLIDADIYCNDADKSLQRQSLDMFRDFVDDRIWCLFFILQSEGSIEPMNKYFAGLIHKFLKLATAGTYYALAVSEFVELAEKDRFIAAQRALERRGLIPQCDDIESLTPEQRSKILRQIENQSAMLSVHWLLQGGEATKETSRRLSVSIETPVDMGVSYASQLTRDLNKNEVYAGKLSQILEDAEADIRLIYWQMLKRICLKNGMHLTANIIPNSHNRPTEIRTALLI